MKYLFVPVLLGLAMTGCTSSEPQGLAGAGPAPETTMPAPAAPSFNATAAASPIPPFDEQPGLAAQAPVTTTVRQQSATAAGFPPPPACGPGTECVEPARIEKCRTVGSVTTCDVPPDPAADSTRYTN
jgi:hypothetical protein